MGKEIVVNTLEDLCQLMCDNVVPSQKQYEFCLRCGRKLKNPEARIKGYGVICEKRMKHQVKQKLF